MNRIAHLLPQTFTAKLATAKVDRDFVDAMRAIGIEHWQLTQIENAADDVLYGEVPGRGREETA